MPKMRAFLRHKWKSDGKMMFDWTRPKKGESIYWVGPIVIFLYK